MTKTLDDPIEEAVERALAPLVGLLPPDILDEKRKSLRLGLALAGILAALPQEPALPEALPVAPRTERKIYLDAWTSAPVYDFDALAPAQTIMGPAIVESAMTTVLLRAGECATVTPLGWLDIAISGE